MNWGAEAQSRLADIAGCSEDGNGVTRFPFTAQHRAAIVRIAAWMETAGLEIHLDAAGTLVGRSAGTGPALLIGSHQDSVRHGGRYDGIMGIVLGCLALEKLRAEGIALPYPVEVLAFADEEGVRFPTALLGPRALAGTLDPGVPDMADTTGTLLGDALRQFGGDPEALPVLAREKDDTRAYLELHIEQGPLLESEGLPLGTVTGICGIERNRVTFRGETGHAGTVPMEARHDALVAAAAFIEAVHDAAPEGVRATVGTLRLHPDVVNAIPDRVDLSLEIRAVSDTARAGFAQWARDLGARIAARRQTPFAMERTYVQPAVPCAEWLMDALDAACLGHQPRAFRLPSGATHDASAMADLCDIGMLFVRCRNGVSHRPEEFASSEDMGAAIGALADVLRSLG